MSDQELSRVCDVVPSGLSLLRSGRVANADLHALPMHVSRRQLQIRSVEV